MSAYGPLASRYDALTTDVPYEKLADYYIRLFAERSRTVRSILDLACGTGTLAAELSRRGYELIAVDRSEEMLAEAMQKFYALPEGCIPPMALCQSLAELDLYGTSDAAVSSLDSLNYLSEEELRAFFSRVRYFLEPGGLLIFDVNPPEYFRALDGQVFVDEKEDLLCLWRAELSAEGLELRYDMDVFRQRGKLWQRDSETHVEYIHEPELLMNLLAESGFRNVEIRHDGPLSEKGRLFFVAENGWYGDSAVQ